MPSVPAALPASRSDTSIATDVGVPLPLGTHAWNGGINFSVFSRHATCLWLELYDNAADAAPRHRFELAPEDHRTGDLWHIWVEGLAPGQLYGYRADGPYAPEDGHRFNPHKLLLDPQATAITHLDEWDYRRALGVDPEAPEQDLSYSREDNEIGWWVWDRLDEHANIHRFVRELIAARKAQPSLRHAGFYTDEALQWIGPHGEPPRWDDSEARALGCYLSEDEGIAVVLLFNAGPTPVDFVLPSLPDRRCWRRKADTSYPSPDDIAPLREAEPLDQQGHYTMGPQSSAILIATP